MTGDGWVAGDAYEAYMGRWSRPLAFAFLDWLKPRTSGQWLDVGCGTGALTAAILESAEPASVMACDSSEAFIDHARHHLPDRRVSFAIADAECLPTVDRGYDLIVSGLALNFFPTPEAAVASMRSRLRDGGSLAAYVWDYSEGMQYLRYFWDEVTATDPRAHALDEGTRFPLCHPSALATLLVSAGFAHVETDALVIPTTFVDFDDYWTPFLRATGPAPSYLASLEPDRQAVIRDRLLQRLPLTNEGIALSARAWAVRGQLM